MEKENRGDLQISGFGSSGGGLYNNVTISGGGNISGSIECIDLKISGMGNIKGDVKSTSVRISGTAGIKGNLTNLNDFTISGAGDVDGDVKTNLIKISGVSKISGNIECEDMTVSGTSSIGGDAIAKKIRVSGTTNIHGSIHGDEVDLRGAADIGGDCECESFKAHGGFKIGGLLNAGDVDIKIVYKCSVNEIGGEKISIRKSDGFVELGRIIKSLFNIPEYLITQSIEGDDIYIENTVAKVVRGNNVTIGPDCEIDLVEYKNEITVMPGARVNKQEKYSILTKKEQI